MEDGSPAADVDVAAFDRDLRSEQLLGQTRTGADGRYEIRYTADAFVRRERAGPDLVVKAFAGTSRDAKSLLAASPTLFNAPPQAEVNLVIRASEWRPASLMERIDRAVRPLLGKVAIEALEQNDKHDDIAFLAGETGFAREALARFVLAHRLAREAIQPEFWFALLGGAWFQYAEDRSLDVQLTGLRSALALVDAAAARKTLVRSFDRNEIPAGLRDNIDKWIAAFMRFAARLAIGDTSQPSVLGWAIERAGIEDADKQRAIAALVAENKGFTRQVVEGLRKHAAFSKQEVADLDVSFQLADLTRGDASVVQAIREDFDVREPAQVRALAHKSTRDWSDLIARKAGEINLPLVGGDDDRAPAPLPAAELYAGQLERRFREAFPTAAFAGGLARALRNGGTHGFEHAAPLQRFLDDHEDFELLTTHIDEFLDKQARPAHRAAARTEGFRRELKATQRVFKLAPRFEATDALLADGVHSAQAIYRMGESKFVQRYAGREGFDRDTAQLVWNRAADTHAAVLTVVADLKAHEAESLPHVLLNGNAALSQFPNWENLFKSGDLCECEHCRSVLSPAAYFADLLMFLRDRHAINPASSAKDILFDRRPDLGFIELNCDNALMPLPYVDVVCEVLEAVIAKGADDVQLAGFTAMPANAAAAKAAVLAAFAAHAIKLGDDFVISQVDPGDPNRWVVHGDDVTYLLKKKGGANFFAEILRNTKAEAADLRAYPAYVSSAAYNDLRRRASRSACRSTCSPPRSAPCSEEQPAALRADARVPWSGPPNNPNDIDIACRVLCHQLRSIRRLRRATAHSPCRCHRERPEGRVGQADQQYLAHDHRQCPQLPAQDRARIQRPANATRPALHQPERHDHHRASGSLVRPRQEAAAGAERGVARSHPSLPAAVAQALGLADVGGGPGHPAGRHRRRHAGRGVFHPALRLQPPEGAARRKTSVEQLCALFGRLTTESRFMKPHERRADGLYQSLFLNKRLIKPLDPAFNSRRSTCRPRSKITGHHPVLLAALGIREADLVILTGLTNASNDALHQRRPDTCEPFVPLATRLARSGS